MDIQNVLITWISSFTERQVEGRNCSGAASNGEAHTLDHLSERQARTVGDKLFAAYHALGAYDHQN
jgi:hypothetical protein